MPTEQSLGGVGDGGNPLACGLDEAAQVREEAPLHRRVPALPCRRPGCVVCAPRAVARRARAFWLKVGFLLHGLAPLQQAVQQPLGLLLDGEDVGADLFQRAQRLRLVEVPREADLVADLGGVFLDPRIGRVGQHLAADEGLDAALFQQRHLLGVAQVGVGLVLDDGGLAVHGRLVTGRAAGRPWPCRACAPWR